MTQTAISKSLSITAAVASLWAVLYPGPSIVCMSVLSLLPWLAISMMAYKGALDLNESKKAMRLHLYFALTFPGIVLFACALRDEHLLSWYRPIFLGLEIDILFFILVVLSYSAAGISAKSIVVQLLFLMPYGCGIVLQSNQLLDMVKPRIFRTTVIGKYISKGRTTGYYMIMGLWGGQLDYTDIPVSKSLYELVHRGNSVCVHLKPGALNIAWYRVLPCNKVVLNQIWLTPSKHPNHN